MYLGMKDGIAVSGTSGRAFPWAPLPWEPDREVLPKTRSHIVGRHRRMSELDSGQSIQAAMESDGEVGVSRTNELRGEAHCQRVF